MKATKLVSHFVRHIIDIECVTGWIRASGVTTALASGCTYATDAACISTTGSIEVVTDIIVRISDSSVDHLLGLRVEFTTPWIGC